jgi:tRNA pseudouridine38-40 synthase
MPNIALLIEYDGTNYAGWQFQPNAISIQEVIEKTLQNLYNTKVSIISAGRTDAGVHSYGQVANFKIENNPIPIEKIPKAINSLLNPDIRVLNANYVPDDFNARYSAIAREYIYKISTKYSVFERNYCHCVPYKIDIDKLFEIAPIFLGLHNFTSFSKNNPDTKSYICNVEKSVWEKIDDYHYYFTIKANRFVYGMVRTIIGTMIDYARGYKLKEMIVAALDNLSRNNISALAPASGLYLNKIYYPYEIFFNNYR